MASHDEGNSSYISIHVLFYNKIDQNLGYEIQFSFFNNKGIYICKGSLLQSFLWQMILIYVNLPEKCQGIFG